MNTLELDKKHSAKTGDSISLTEANGSGSLTEASYAATEREILLGLSWQAKAVFFRQLASGVGSGLPLARAIELASSALPARMRGDIILMAGSGQLMSQILARYAAAFERYELVLLQSGEKSGNLDINLKKLAEYAEAEYARHNQQMAQAVYPLLLIHAAAIIPAVPLGIMRSSCAFWQAVATVLVPLYGVAAVIYVLQRWARLNRSLDETLSALANAIPIVASWRRQEAQARFLLCFSQLQDAGLLATESLAIASASCGNASFERRLTGLADSVGQGVALSRALRDTGFFSEQVLALLATGEETGNLSDMAARTAEILRQEADSTRKKLAVVLPVLVLLAVGVFVGYQVIGVFQGLARDMSSVI